MFFTLKNPNSAEKTLIYLRYYCKNSKSYFKISTKLSINPKDWNFKSRMPITKRGLANVEARQLTHHLTKFDDILQSTINTYGASLTKEHLKNAYTPTDADSLSVDVLYGQFIDEKKNLSSVSNKTLQKYIGVSNKYKSYCKTKYLKHNVIDLDDNFYVGFIAYLRHNHNLNNNTLSRYLVYFKSFVLWCERKGIDINNDYKGISVKGYQSDDIALTVEEVKTLEDAELTGAEERARDLFLIGVYSGQRFSDYSVFDRSDIRGNFIVKRAEKTESHSYIPMHDKLKAMLNKYDWRLPKITSQKFNLRIQVVCEKLGFNEKIKKTSYKGSDKTVEVLPKWKMIGSHTARRTYITLMSEKGMADHFIMAVTGIKDIKTLAKYKKLNKDNLFSVSSLFWT